MPETALSTEHMDYLQRIGLTPSPMPAGVHLTNAPPDLRRLLRIRSIGRIKDLPVTGPGQHPGKPVRMPSEEIMVGLYGYKIPLVFLVWGQPGDVAIHLGTWSPEVEKDGTSAGMVKSKQHARIKVINTLLDSLYPAIELEDADPNFIGKQIDRIKNGLTEQAQDTGEQSARLIMSGLALGVPTAKPPDPADGALPLDRLIRAMSGANWGCMLLAQPVDEIVARDLRYQVINEVRATGATAKAERAPSALANQYSVLLEKVISTLTEGQIVGTWRTAVYLIGSESSYYRLASVWRSIFSGEHSLPDPVSVWDQSKVTGLAASWSMPDVAGPSRPGSEQYRFQYHQFQYQTLLTSSQLAAYVHLPKLETTGFAVRNVPDLDAVPPRVKGEKVIDIGKVIRRTRPVGTSYRIDLESLTRHTFVAGVTGSGKSNTVFHLLKQIDASRVPFLVIEPAKREYRTLLNDPDLAERLRVFTLGDERYSPFRLNPFEVLGWPKTSVGVHIDLLRSVFSASFGMWTPLPQVLEECLHRIYEDRGWDITTNTNSRLDSGSDVTDAFPTLSDLLDKVIEVTRELGYDKEAMERIRAALRTRINSLRTGGKGCMLNVKRSLPMEELLENPTVLELEDIGDDDDKAFMIGLLFIRLVEYRRAGKGVDYLQHVMVIEEAHRLLANVGQGGREEQADPRGKAVETFANLLSEIRAYGQGIIVADQVPVKLAPDVIKNTNLKIAHRIVAADDRAALAGAMAMKKKQDHVLDILGLGEAVVFAEGDDAPLLVKVPRAKGRGSGIEETEERPVTSGERVKDTWKQLIERQGLGQIFKSYKTCELYCNPPNPRCTDSRQIVEVPEFEEAFASMVVSLVAGSLIVRASDLPALLKAFYHAVHRVMLGRLSGEAENMIETRCIMTHALYRYMDKRGIQYGWKYNDLERMTTLFLPSLLAAAEKREVEGSTAEKLSSFCEEYESRCQRSFEPFYGCAAVCGESPLCLYRYNVEPLLLDDNLDDRFKKAGNDWKELATRCERAVERAIASTLDSTCIRAAAMCYAIQKTHSDLSLWDKTMRQFIIRSLLKHYAEQDQSQ